MLLEHVDYDDLFRVYSRRYYRWKYILVANITEVMAHPGAALTSMVAALDNFGFPLKGNFAFPGWALLEADENTLKLIRAKLTELDIDSTIYHDGYPILAE